MSADLLEAMLDLDRVLAKFNDEHDETGRFAPSGGGGGGGADKPSGGSLRERAAAAREWLRGKTAGDVISAAVASHGLRDAAKEGLSLVLQGLINHGTGLDASTWRLTEDAVDHSIREFSTIAKMTQLQSKQVFVDAIKGLMDRRQKQVEARMMSNNKAAGDKDPILDILGRMLDAVEAHVPVEDSDAKQMPERPLVTLEDLLAELDRFKGGRGRDAS